MNYPFRKLTFHSHIPASFRIRPANTEILVLKPEPMEFIVRCAEWTWRITIDPDPAWDGSKQQNVPEW